MDGKRTEAGFAVAILHDEVVGVEGSQFLAHR